jgi:DNA segregation ATPase FtsK/SpoIIIE-like protein
MASKIKVILLLICATDWVCGKRDSTSTEYFDLSYSFSKDTIFFPGQKDFTLNKDYDQVNKSGVQ